MGCGATSGTWTCRPSSRSTTRLSERGDAGRLGYFVGRWSEDRPDYPRWPDDPARPVRVLDQVGSALIDWNNQDSVRTENWNAVSVPVDERKLVRSMSQSSLRGR